MVGSLNFHFKLVTAFSAGARYPTVFHNTLYIWEQQTAVRSLQMFLSVTNHLVQ